MARAMPLAYPFRVLYSYQPLSIRLPDRHTSACVDLWWNHSRSFFKKIKRLQLMAERIFLLKELTNNLHNSQLCNNFDWLASREVQLNVHHTHRSIFLAAPCAPASLAQYDAPQKREEPKWLERNMLIKHFLDSWREQVVLFWFKLILVLILNFVKTSGRKFCDLQTGRARFPYFFSMPLFRLYEYDLLSSMCQ